MRYIDSTLLHDEKLIYFTSPHWVVFLPSLLAFLASGLFWYFGPLFVPIDTLVFRNWSFIELVSVGVLLFAIYWFIGAFIFYRFSEYAITDRRVILKEGFIERRAVEIFLRRLEGINIEQTVVGRILDYGTLIVIGTGGTKDYYYNIPHPFAFRKIVQQQTDLLIDDESSIGHDS